MSILILRCTCTVRTCTVQCIQVQFMEKLYQHEYCGLLVLYTVYRYTSTYEYRKTESLTVLVQWSTRTYRYSYCTFCTSTEYGYEYGASVLYVQYSLLVRVLVILVLHVQYDVYYK